MDSHEFAKKVQRRVKEFCNGLDDNLPRLQLHSAHHRRDARQGDAEPAFQRGARAEVFGSWLKTTPELEVKAILAEAIHEEFVHAEYLSEALKSKGAVPYDYKPVPAQMAMFNGFEALTTTCERIAAFPFAGEGVADYLIGKSLEAGTVPEWVPALTRRSTTTRKNTATTRSICSSSTPPAPRSRTASSAPWR